MIPRALAVVSICAIALCACEAKQSASSSMPQKAVAVAPAAVAAPVKVAAAAQPAAPVAPSGAVSVVAAKIGEAAPDFTLKGIDGKAVTLSGFKGKTVVLEWFNPHCPFVNLSHTKGTLVDLAARRMKEGVVWLAINSAGPGKEGYGVEANLDGQKRFNLTHPILIDEDGKVGHAYGAAHTPHMFIVNAQRVLVYHGAPDNSPDAEGASPTGGKLINYIDAALADLAAKRPVAIPETQAYGCGVKYGAS